MKRIISLILTFTLILTSLTISPVYAESDDISLYTGEINFNDGVTRAEWLTALTRAYNMEVEDDHYPDNYFSDLDSSSPFYYDLLVAVNFGLINVEAGEELYPNEPVTREFAVQTLNYCIAYQNENEDYSFSDSEDVTYLDDAQVAVDQGWIKLSNGKFLPDQLISASEATSMIDIAEQAYEDIQIDADHENVYEYADDVVVYDETIEVEYNDNVVTIYDTDTALKAGDTYSVYLNGIPVVFKAVKVTKGNLSTVVESEELNVYEGFDEIDAQGQMELSAIEIGEVEGLDLSYEEEPASSYLARGAINLGKNGKLKASGKLELTKGMEVKLDYELKNAKLEYKFTSNETYIKLSGKSEYAFGISANALEAMEKHEVTILPATCPGLGGLDIVAEFAIAGELTGKTEGYLVTGVSYSESNGFRLIREFKATDFYLSCEVEGSAGIKVRLGITGDLIPVNGYLWAKAGGKVKLARQTYPSGTPEQCRTFSAYVYASAGATISIKILKYKKDYTAEIEFFNEDNSPIRIYHHYEDGVEVCECTRGTDFKYHTPASSRYHGVGDGNASSYGYDEQKRLYQLYEYTLNENNEATITNYYGLAFSLYLPKTIDGYTVTAIGDKAFKENKFLLEVHIPDTVTTIGNGAFLDCISLYEVTLPKDINTVENVAANYMYPGPFYGCTNLTEVNFADGTTYIDDGLFSNSGISEITIPATVTEIRSKAFSNANKLYDVTMYEGITYIGDYAFNECDALEEVHIPESVETLGIGTFNNCDQLYKVNIPKDVKTHTYAGDNYMYPGPFSGCNNLEVVDFHKDTTVINRGLFYKAGIKEITLPDNLTKIETKAFSDCTQLTSVQFNNKLESMNWYAFASCTALKEAILPVSLTYVDCGAFNNCTSLEKIFVPASMKFNGFIGANYMYPTVFNNCSALKTVEFEKGIKKIQPYLLNNTGIESIEIPDTVEYIDGCAFSNCTLLKEVKLPDSLITLNGHAFKNTGLEHIELPDSIQSMGTNMFYNCKSLTSVKLPLNIKAVPANTFEGCTALEEITLPDSVTEIQTAAFKNATALKKVNFNTNITTLGNYAFENCDSLSQFIIPETVTHLGEGCFYLCDGLTSIEIPNSVVTLGKRVFDNCSNLANITIGTGINTITQKMFVNCTALNSIVLPYSITSVQSEAFANNTSLTQVTIHSSAASIAANAFNTYDNITFYGTAGSYLETFASDNNAQFESISIPVTSITIDQREVVLNKNASKQLTLSIEPYNTTDTVKWKSSDESIVQVSSEGKITAKGIGQAVITVTAGNKTVQCNVKTVQPVTRINLNKTSISMNALETFKLEAEITPSDAYNTNVEWSSNDSSIVEVDQYGNITAKSKGKTKITVKALDGSNVSKTCEVTVVNDIITVYDINRFESSHNYEHNSQDIYIYRIEDASNLDITFDTNTNIHSSDSIKIYDSNDKVIGTYTGTQLAGKTVTVPGNTVKVQLISDSTDSAWGFKVVDVSNNENYVHFPFTDVHDYDWYKPYVNEAYQLGLMTGASDTLFKPTVSMNRGMVAIVLHRMEGSEKTTFETLFPDVKAGEYYAESVIWAKQKGVINGYGDGTFRPLRLVTREEMAQMIYNFAKYKEVDVSASADLSKFLDGNKVSVWHKDAMIWANANGLITGKYNGTKLDPQGTATRAECCKMLVEAYKTIYK